LGKTREKLEMMKRRTSKRKKNSKNNLQKGKETQIGKIGN